MSQIPSPPEGYTCTVLGFDNMPDKASDKMPTPKAIDTPLADRVMDHSNTIKLPFGGPVVPKGI